MIVNFVNKALARNREASRSKIDYDQVIDDIRGLKTAYPWVEVILIPLVEYPLIFLKGYLVTQEKINCLNLKKEYLFNEDYSSLVYCLIPLDYRTEGCEIYGLPWLDVNNLIEKHQDDHMHIYLNSKIDGYFELCTGTPNSFRNLKNVVLEGFKTAEAIYLEYKLFQQGFKDKIELIEYSHGVKGIKEYARKYKNKRLH